MGFLNEFLPIIIYILLIVLITILIIIAIKLSKTMDKVDALVDDVNGKMNSLNSLFNIVDGVTSKASLLGDKFVSLVVSIGNKLFKNKKEDKEEE